jgi:integrase/recombinase XerD
MVVPMKNNPIILEGFEQWLIGRKYVVLTIAHFLRQVTLFTSWLSSQDLTETTAGYKDLLAYIGYLQSLEKSKSNINTTLRIIAHYYQYLNTLSVNQISNIALNVRLRGVAQYQPLLLTEAELLDLYQEYQTPVSNRGYYKYSNKLILGFLIFQGLDRHDILKLELSDLDLEKGKLYVPGGARIKNSRTLLLEAHQIYPLHSYITQYRGIGKNGIKSKSASQKLFHPNCDNEHRLNEQCSVLTQTIKKQFPKLAYKSLSQLKHSRISIWITQYGLRKAQYLSGYKGVDGIERYRNQDMNDLTQQIEKFHPLQ